MYSDIIEIRAKDVETDDMKLKLEVILYFIKDMPSVVYKGRINGIKFRIRRDDDLEDLLLWYFDRLKHKEWEKKRGGTYAQRKKAGMVIPKNTHPQLKDSNYKPKGRKDYYK